MLRIDDMIKSQLVLTAWRYSTMYGVGGHLTSCIIMSCLANRQRHGWGEWLHVINTIPNYAAESNVPVGYPEVWEPSFVRLLQEVGAIYDGTTDYAKGGLYWCDLRKVETQFFKENILGQLQFHPKVVDMNSFSVFK